MERIRYPTKGGEEQERDQLKLLSPLIKLYNQTESVG